MFYLQKGKSYLLPVFCGVSDTPLYIMIRHVVQLQPCMFIAVRHILIRHVGIAYETQNGFSRFLAHLLRNSLYTEVFGGVPNSSG